MFKNYLRVAVRNVIKHKMYALINICGLAIGLACTILISMWVRDESSFDRFHQNGDDLYRVNWDFKWNNNEGVGPGTPPPLAAALSREIPEVDGATRVYPVPKMVVRHGDKFFNESRIFAVDSNFFEFFDFRLEAGNAETALDEPNSVILTGESARKYFGDEPALGKILTIGDEQEMFRKRYDNVFKVTGIVENPPHNSHLQFDMLTSMSSHPAVGFFDWSWVWMQVATYVKLDAGVSAPVVEAKIPAIVEKYAPAAFTRVGFSLDELLSSGGRWGFVLQPLTDIYLGSNQIGNRLGPIGNRVYVYLFSIIAGLILLVACINFMNLATARSANRAREVGVRKALGSQRRQLVGQFLMESILFSLLALPIALFLVELFIVTFNDLSGKSLQFNLFDPLWLPAALVVITLAVGLVTGSYPGFYLSSFRPVQVLKGKFQSGTKNQRFRNVLVVFQFAITIGLIACTLLVQKQMNFVRQIDLGFNKEGVVILSNDNNRLGDQAEAFKLKLRANSRIISASLATGVPPYWGFQDYYKIEGRGDEQFDLISYMADDDFLKTLDIRIMQGRGFSRDFATDAESVILNEAAVRLFGWNDDPIGKILTYPGSPQGEARYKVIGVMKDFNFMALYSPITPFALFHTSSRSYDIPDSYVVVRIPPADVENTIQALESEWKSFAPTTPFEYTFLDESLDAEYQAEQRLGKLFLMFSGLTIFIACIGLLGLAAFSAERRTKEIGIRKVLGASVPNVTALLSKEFTKWVILANFIAWPTAYFAMNHWLQNFAYRVEIGWWPFALAGGLALLIALLTVSTQAVKAALANPVEALRYE
ncbi:MAG TPA: ABC transporter permease [bacterium]